MDDDIGVSASKIIEMVSAQFSGLQPDEVTVRMYMEMETDEGLKYGQAAARLNSLVELGLMTRREVVHEGARRFAYRWIGGDESDG